MNFVFFFVFLLGLVVGSFLNVVILRYNSGLGIGGRSKCFSCAVTLKWHELIPLFSYLFLKGRCKNCKSIISIQYFLVELTTGILFLFFFWKNTDTYGFLLESLLLTLILWVLWSILIVIFVYDIRHHIIPDGLVFSFIILGFLSAFIKCEIVACSNNFFKNHILAGFILFIFIFFLWFISKGKWIGFGDAKLAFGMGAYLGMAGGLSALAFGFWIGAGIGLILLAYQKIVIAMHFPQLSLRQETLTMKSSLPFAPFLILGTFLSVFLGSDVFGINLFF